MSNQQKTFRDTKEHLNPAARVLLEMPDYGQVDDNLVNMSNFFPLIRDLVDAVAPSSICEIGSDQGMTTRLLREYCKKNNCELHSVDPSFEKTEPVDDLTYLHKCLSVEYLENEPPSEVYFLDGDHNYYTADKELRLIRDQKPAGQPCVVFVHDVGWPWGRVDMYYDKANIPEEMRKASEENALVSLFHGADPTHGQGLPMNGLSVALNDEEKAGIATAVQDFLAESSGWEYISIPSIFGLGVLVFPESENSEVARTFNEIRNHFERFEAFLSILEFNRIALLEKINESGFIWSEQQAVIDEYGEAINQQKEVINSLEQDLKEREETRIADEKKMAKDLEELQGYTSELETYITKITSVPGWLKHRMRGFRK